MTTYGLALVTVAVPFLVFGFGTRGAYLSGVLVAGFLLTCGIAEFISRRRARSDFEHGRCPRCGYDTRANAGRCPECGDDLTAHAAEYWRGYMRRRLRNSHRRSPGMTHWG